MTKILEYLQQEWSAVSSAPFTFFILSTLIWGTIHIVYKYRLQSAKDIISLQKQKLDIIKDKTRTSSVEEAIERLESVEQIIEESKLEHAKI